MAQSHDMSVSGDALASVQTIEHLILFAYICNARTAYGVVFDCAELLGLCHVCWECSTT